jgi:hypothetical protein
VIHTEEGATYTPWTDGYAVGYKVTAEGKPDRWILLNPSQTDSENESNVFVYLESGEPTTDRPPEQSVCYILIWGDEATATHPSARDRSEQTVYRLTAADIDGYTGRRVADDELGEVAKAIGHSSVPEAVSEVVHAVCDPSYCRECGELMWLEDNGVSHHWSDDTIDNIDHDTDGDHVAIAED